MTRSTALITAFLVVLSFSSIGYSQTDSLLFTPPDFRLFGVSDEEGSLEPQYAVVSFIITNHLDSTQLFHFTLHSNQNLFSEEGEKLVPYEMWTRRVGGESDDWVEYLKNTDTLSFRSCDLTKSYGTDTIHFNYHPKSDPTDIYQIISVVSFDSNTSIMPVDERGFSLSQALPNPFGGRTRFEYYLPFPEKIDIMLYEVDGTLVDTVLSDWMSAGTHRIPIINYGICSSVYILRVKFENQVHNRRMMLIR
jgi:hypothetical protein